MSGAAVCGVVTFYISCWFFFVGPSVVPYLPLCESSIEDGYIQVSDL